MQILEKTASLTIRRINLDFFDIYAHSRKMWADQIFTFVYFETHSNGLIPAE